MNLLQFVYSENKQVESGKIGNEGTVCKKEKAVRFLNTPAIIYMNKRGEETMTEMKMTVWPRVKCQGRLNYEAFSMQRKQAKSIPQIIFASPRTPARIVSPTFMPVCYGLYVI